MKTKALSGFVLILVLILSCSQENKSNSHFPVLKGPYLGQIPPGNSPELFAPGIISNGLSNRDVAISPDGNEMNFGLHTPDFSYSTILISQQINGIWTEPEVANFALDPRYVYLEPALSPDGKKMFFLSNLPTDTTDNPGGQNIWAVDRVDKVWGKPYNLGEPINTDGNEFYPSLTNDGTLYFTRADKGTRIHFIYRSRLVDGKYITPEKLPEQVNCGTNRYNAYVAPDETYVVVPAVGGIGSLGGTDYYIVYRNEDDTWEEPINMGPVFNSPTGGEWSFYVSPDKKYIFFMATRVAEDKPESLSLDFFLNLAASPENGNPDIYWVDAKVLENYRNFKE